MYAAAEAQLSAPQPLISGIAKGVIVASDALVGLVITARRGEKDASFRDSRRSTRVLAGCTKRSATARSRDGEGCA